jgi:hypothetical protein
VATSSSATRILVSFVTLVTYRLDLEEYRTKDSDIGVKQHQLSKHDAVRESQFYTGRVLFDSIKILDFVIITRLSGLCQAADSAKKDADRAIAAGIRF